MPTQLIRDVAQEIPVRRMDFAFPDDLDLVFIEGDPQLSYFFLGAWMMLPYLEPYLIRTVQTAMERVTDADLKEEMKRFCAQEAQHYRQHAKANDVIRRTHPSGPQLEALEREVEALLKRWSAKKPLRFNLAYAEGFESMTAAGSVTQMELGWFDHMKEPIRGLMLWHIMEEIEHRSVCFETYEKAGAGYLYRLGVGMWAQAHYLKLCQRFAAAMIAADPEVIARYATPELENERRARMNGYRRKVLPRQLATYLPWYSPRNMRLPSQFESVRAEFSALAVSIQ
ncbi:MAG: metal-dependent hydrolase [Terricaulis sp.]